jgi:hypothetical protein
LSIEYGAAVGKNRRIFYTTSEADALALAKLIPTQGDALASLYMMSAKPIPTKSDALASLFRRSSISPQVKTVEFFTPQVKPML